MEISDMNIDDTNGHGDISMESSSLENFVADEKYAKDVSELNGRNLNESSTCIVNKSVKSALSKTAVTKRRPMLQRDQSIQATFETSKYSRTSLIEGSACRRARKVTFFINGDRYFKGIVVAVSGEKFRTLEKLLEHLTNILAQQVSLLNGVRFIFDLQGHAINDIDLLVQAGNAVCSSVSIFKKIDYLRPLNTETSFAAVGNKFKRDTVYLGFSSNAKFQSRFISAGRHRMSAGENGDCQKNRRSFIGPGNLPNLTESLISPTIVQNQTIFKPKIIAVIRSGKKPRKTVRILLNGRNTKCLEAIFSEVTNHVKLDAGAVRRIFTLEGKPILSVSDFAQSDVFVACGSDKIGPDDFLLDAIEFSCVQEILRNSELYSIYSKYVSPTAISKSLISSNGRRSAVLNNSVNSRISYRRKSSKSRALEPSVNDIVVAECTNLEGREGVVTYADGDQCNNEIDVQTNFLQNENLVDYPDEITSRYNVGDILGDGNFAVVRYCTEITSGLQFALKIIDKLKCVGKDWTQTVIESEIRILQSVEHPHIIKLFHVFDFPSEKYLVTELVPGGDLFNDIAINIKYSESVSRIMLCDLVSAIKYLHHHKIVHRDIKPENLFVFLKNTEGEKSLKLGDFGLAHVVEESLFTVCGTPTYVAPEILSETGYGVKVDVWATGIILYILLCGFPPFCSRSNEQEELFDQILSGIFEFSSPEWDEISYSVKELISWMLQVDPLQRFSAFEILQHPWVCSKRTAVTE